jgi:PAS domain S-box-containing protein
VYCELAHAIRQAVDRRSAQIESLKREAKLNAILESSPEAITITDLDGNIVECNQATADLHGGQSKEDLIGKNALEFIAKKDHEKAIQNLKKMIEQGSVKTVEYPLLTEDGREFPGEWSASVVRDALGKPEYVVAITRDITERKKAVEALRQTKEYLDNLLNYANAPVIVWDNEQKISLFNNAFVALTGYKKESVLGRNIDVLFPPLQKTGILQTIERATQGEKWQSVEVPILCKDEETRIALWNSANITDKDGNIVATIAQGQDITERKKAEEALRKSEEKWRSLAENAPNVIMIVDRVGTIQFINRTVVDARPEEIVGRSVYDFIDPEHHNVVKKTIEKVFQTGEGRGYEISGVGPKGGVSWYETHVGSIKRDGQIVSVTLITTDITEHKKAEDALRKSESKYRTLLENLPQKIFLKDKNLVYVSCNENYAGDLEIESNEIAGKTDYDFYPKELAEKYRADDKRIMKSGKKEDIEEEYVKNGQKVYVHTVKTPVKDENGNVVGVLGIFWDITERKTAEIAIQDAREYVESIVATVREPLIVLDKELRVISASRAFCLTFKVTPEETEGLRIYEVGNQQWNIPSLRRLLEEILPSNTTFDDFEVDYCFPKIGRRVMFLNARRIYRGSDHTQMILLAIEDITEKKLLQEELVTSEKLAAIGQLASVVGHEIRNPLGVIKNSAYFLNMKLKDAADEKVVKHLKILEKEINSANLIISDLLGFASKKTPTLDKTDLNETVKNTLSYITVPENIKVEIKLGEIPKMLLDKEQVQRVCQNLTLNAVQAMPEGGKLTIQTTKQDDSANLIVRDTGVGIPKENMPKLFTPLFSTKAKGIGLGLAICKQIVESHDGNITVESRVGEGSTFTVKLPIRTEKEISEQSAFTVPMPIEERVKIEK